MKPKCEECEFAHIVNVLHEVRGSDQDYNTGYCDHPDLDVPPTVDTRYKREYSNYLGRWLEPGSWEVPGDTQILRSLEPPDFCPLRPDLDQAPIHTDNLINSQSPPDAKVQRGI